MGNILCPKCSTPVDSADVNVQTDMAKCGNCGHVFTLSKHVKSAPSNPKFDIASAPPGASFEWLANGFRIKASTRSPLAFFLVPFSIVWVTGAISGVGSLLAQALTNPGEALFGLPFAIGAVFLITYSFMFVFGRVEISADGMEGKVFTGVGPFGWSRRFSWQEFDRVSEDESTVRLGRNSGHLIRLEGKRRLSFGSLLNEERRYFMVEGIRQMMDRRQRYGL